MAADYGSTLSDGKVYFRQEQYIAVNESQPAKEKAFLVFMFDAGG
jgi:hypothetical protein